MAKQTYTKEERKAQFLKTGVKLAKKNGVAKVSAAAVAAEHKVTAPLVFHIFGSREGLQRAIKSEAKKQGVVLPEPKRKRSVAEVKAIKNKAAVTKKVTRSAKDGKFVTKATAKKRPATTITQTVAVKSSKPKKFATVTPPSVNPEANPSDTQ